MILVGLTGGIASGKSTVSSILKNDFNCPVIDADLVAREVVQPGRKAYKAIVECFGEEVIAPDGEIDRAKLGEIIFNDVAKRKILNKITHPEIGKAIILSVLKYFVLGHQFIILDVPLLFESKTWINFTAFNVVVNCDNETQLSRLMNRNDLSKEEATQRIESQMSLREKCKLATHVVDNNGSLEATYCQVEKFYEELSSSKKYLFIRTIFMFIVVFVLYVIFAVFL